MGSTLSKMTATRSSASFWMATMFLGLWAGISSDVEAGLHWVRLSDVEHLRSEAILRARGTTNLPDGVILTASVWYCGATGAFQSVEVRDGAFQLQFGPVQGTIVPGAYRIKVQCRLQDQSPELARQLEGARDLPQDERLIEVEGPGEAVKEYERVQKHLERVLENLRLTYRDFQSRSSYTIARVVKEFAKNEMKLPENQRRRIYQEWERFFEARWTRLYQDARLSFKEYQEQVFLTPFPEADREIGSLLSLFPRWAYACYAEVCAALEVPVPEEVQGYASFKHTLVRDQILETRERAYKALRLPVASWEMIDLGRPEEGDQEGLLYRSRTAKFEIARPSEQWRLELPQGPPSLRLRMRPQTPGIVQDAVIAVEILDHPQSESYEDLEKIAEITARERYGGYRKLSGNPIKKKDATMPETGGYRPGYEIVCLTDVGGKGFKVREYTLFCRWAKRVYNALCIAPEPEFDKVKEDFERACESFMILDAPEPEALSAKNPEETSNRERR